MDPNKVVLNPKADESANLVCSRCNEEIVEVSTENQNWFKCGCDGLVEFSTKIDDHTDSDENLLDEIDSIEELGSDGYKDCWKCGGSGVLSSSLGEYGGSTECDVCGGDGKYQRLTNNG